MVHILTDFLDETAKRLPDKVAYVDPARQVTFSQTRREAQLVAQGLVEKGLFKKPVAVFVDKSIECILSVLGIAYSGNFYTVIDTEMPRDRIDKILSTLEPEAFVTTRDKAEIASDLACQAPVLIYEDLQEGTLQEEKVQEVTSRVLPTDVLYVLFTSGSTGMPKGVVTSHNAVVQYMSMVFGPCYGLAEGDVFLSQAPFYFVMALMDMFGPICLGATTHIVPPKYYSFPAMLVKYIEENKATVLNWVPSALLMVANMDAFEVGDISSVRRVLFGGEVMPMKAIQAWKEHAPEVHFLNGYGATEVTDGCASYWVEGDVPDGRTLPIGKAQPNMDVFLLDENDQLVREAYGVGEICVRSPSLAYGYYRDPERTREVFVQNPLNPCYEEKIYRTGDLACYNENGDLEYMGRKDFQIKYMGYRIELGEIESNISPIPGIEENACVYNTQSKHIVLFYTGSIDSKDLGSILKAKLPEYMLPRKRIKLEEMPHNAHGKIDRSELRRRMERMK